MLRDPSGWRRSSDIKGIVSQNFWNVSTCCGHLWRVMGCQKAQSWSQGMVIQAKPFLEGTNENPWKTSWISFILMLIISNNATTRHSARSGFSHLESDLPLPVEVLFE